MPRYHATCTGRTAMLSLVCALLCPGWLVAADGTSTKPGVVNTNQLATWKSITNRWAAVSWDELKQAAQSGDSTAQLYLALSIRSGRGQEQNPAAALEWLKAASDSGLAAARVELGCQYQAGRTLPRDYAAAERLFRLAAEQGHPMGQNNLGNLYLQGWGVPKDPAEAVRWFRKSAEQGEAIGQANLGWAYENGVGAERDRPSAELWTRKAAEQGLAYAQCAMGRMAEHQPRTGGNQAVAANYEVAAEWYLKAAQQGHAQAMFNLAELYNYGKLDYNYPEAVKWYEKAANRGLQAAAMQLGDLYSENHPDFPANLTEAIRWYRVSAETGDQEAQYRLGCLLLDEKSGRQNRAEAEQWLNKAAESGFAEANIRLASLRNQSPDTVAASLTRDELERAASRGEGQTRLILGKAYEEGVGGPIDSPAAARTYWWVANAGPDKDRPEALRRVVKLYAAKKIGFDTTETRFRLPASREELAKWLDDYRRLIPPGETEFEISEMFLHGELLPENKSKAVEWLTQAAKNGSAPAMNRLGDFWAAGSGGQTNLHEAVRWYAKAATNGLAAAQLNLARAYLDGRGVPHDLVEAAAWMRLAAARKNSEAIAHLPRIETRLTPDQSAAAQQRVGELGETMTDSAQREN